VPTSLQGKHCYYHAKTGRLFWYTFPQHDFLFVCFDGGLGAFFTPWQNKTSLKPAIISSTRNLIAPMLGGQNIDFFLLRHQSTLLDGQHFEFQIVKTTIKIIVGDPDPYLWLIDPDSDPTLDPTPFFLNFKDAKKISLFIFFHITCPQAHHFQSKKFNFWLKFFVKSYFRHCVSPLNTFMRKGKDPEPDPDPNDLDPGGPKTGEKYKTCSLGGSPAGFQTRWPPACARSRLPTAAGMIQPVANNKVMTPRYQWQ
jgi:hypothetical protein